MTDSHVKALAQQVAAVIKEYVAPLRKSVDELRRDVRDDVLAKLDSFERRLSRHADHLAALESKVKRIEKGTPT